MEAVNLPGLKPYERAFELPSGRLAKVSVTRRTPEDPKAADRCMFMNVAACEIDAEGNEAERRPLVQVHTVDLDALANGAIDVEALRAQATVEALDKLERFMTAADAVDEAFPPGDGS